jgi:alpha-mannosidase
VPVAVHVSPTRLTLAGDSAGAGAHDGDGGGAEGRLQLSVAGGPEPAGGEVELVVPDGLLAEIDGTPVTAQTRLAYDVADRGFATWEVAVRARPGTPNGRYFLAARIRDGLGQQLEDTALVTIGEPGGPDASQPPEELFFRLQADVQALVAEAALEVLTPELRLAPGERGELTVRVSSRLASQLRGEAQLISPIGTWQAAVPWTQAVEVAPGGEATVSFGVTVPATATPGWHSWLLVKLMYFGRVLYSKAVALTVD